ncbi:DUF3576 domain-containing protein [Cognatishimia sp. F0-27]|uniref:DUF3576 domain-containing protein n=1 Tax=Cognatishimia sp. F0-27 TaxID=2816855 RepID=UPI001D0C64E8|nr:DUF3576 domain-containing protein [Cognatishimia sp. F0-27]MCC1491428.1 DUF3576 domain-containing protein [Cognatishimia sp. F0-27]
MTMSRKLFGLTLAGALLFLAGCGAFGSREAAPAETPPADEIIDSILYEDGRRPRSTLWDFFRSRPDQGQIGAVNRYIWNAALETLNFLPVESADPFTGVISTGYGTPPGGGRAYRATIYVSDPALDARSLNIAMQTRGGAVDPATVRAIEDAILTRARQLRARDSRF